ncbi:MAG: hypothetical protein K2X56_12860 [Mycobacterium pseudokansasii]|uniref:hypothetical protein n=1 Tax=Mycobacterium pseudokansasii TaxID=2341080 RepID=UPI0023F0E788|nr:hypothetical protein [Mycobacterium pseudokansasii]MBY0388962.1 hypothetical protein [Mycobacterium pseudokansasii]
MHDIVDPDTGTYVDRLTVIYELVAYPDKPPQETVVLIVDAGKQINREEFRRQVEQLHYRRTDDGQLLHEPFQSSERYGHFSWGAAAAHLELVVQVASWALGGIVGNAAYDTLKKVGQQISSGHADTERPQQIDDQLAITRATQIAVAKFKDVKASGLTVLSVSVEGDTATVVMRYQDGSTFTIQPSLFDGGAIGPIVRAYPEE